MPKLFLNNNIYKYKIKNGRPYCQTTHIEPIITVVPENDKLHSASLYLCLVRLFIISAILTIPQNRQFHKSVTMAEFLRASIRTVIIFGLAYLRTLEARVKGKLTADSKFSCLWLGTLEICCDLVGLKSSSSNLEVSHILSTCI